MTQRQSFPLIGIDFQGQEHVLEHEGYTAGQAGRELAQDKGNLIKVFLDCSKIRNGRHAGGPPRKLVYCRKGYESYQTPGVGAGIMAEALSQASLDVAGMLIKGWTKRGIRLEIDEQDGNTDVFITPKGVATDEDRRDIEENKESLIAAIRQRNLAEVADKQAQENEEVTEEDKVSLRETIRRVLPDLPKEFGISDVQNQLRSWRQDDLAADKKCLHNLMHWVVQEGYAKRHGRGRYLLVEEKIETISPPPREPAPPTSAVNTVVETQPPTPSLVALEKDMSLQQRLEAARRDLLTLEPQQPTQLPLAAAQPATPEPTQAAAVPPLVSQEKPREATPITTSLLQSAAPVQEALILLVAELAAGGIDETVLSQAQKGINDVFESVTNALAPIEALLTRIRQANANKGQLLRTFSALKAP